MLTLREPGLRFEVCGYSLLSGAYASKIRGLFKAGHDCARSFPLIQCGAWHLGCNLMFLAAP